MHVPRLVISMKFDISITQMLHKMFIYFGNTLHN